MRHELNDNNKQRLVEPDEIMTAISILRMHGLDDDTLLRELTKLFYIDLDTYNELVQAACRTLSQPLARTG